MFELCRLGTFLPSFAVVRKAILMNGEIADVAEALTGDLSDRGPDVLAWGFRALRNYVNAR
jgi:hypothetical protein